MTTRDPMGASFYECMLEDDPAVASKIGWKNELCSTCDGEGTTWDGIVLTQQDFDEDPDGQHEAIMNGYYDRPCPECKGEKVLSYIDEVRTDVSVWVDFVRFLRDEADYRAMERQERMMGA